METFSALLALCGVINRSTVNSPHKGQWCGALMFFYLRPNKRLSSQSWGWWFDTPSRSLCRHRNVSTVCTVGPGAWCPMSSTATSVIKSFMYMKLKIKLIYSYWKFNLALYLDETAIKCYCIHNKTKYKHDGVIKWKLFSALLAFINRMRIHVTCMENVMPLYNKTAFI